MALEPFSVASSTFLLTSPRKCVMDGKRPDLRVIPGLGAVAGPVATAASKNVVSPEPASKLGRDEREAWDYICQLFREAGVEHMTAGLAIEMICCKWVLWRRAFNKCQREGSTLKSKNGGEYEAPWASQERALSNDLIRLFGQNGMTVMSNAKVKAITKEGPPQDDLFDSLVGHARSHPSAASG